MEGIFIYWFGWGLWIVISFFWSKSNRRLWSAAAILVFLSLLPFNIETAERSIPIAFLLFSFYVLWQIRCCSIKELLFYLLASWTIGTAYGALQLIIILDPVIQIMDERWMSACLVSALAFLLAIKLKTRLIVALLGLIQGEYLLSLVVNRLFHLNNEIGSLSFFDTVAIVGLLFGSGWSLKCLSSWMNKTMMKNQTHPLKQTS